MSADTIGLIERAYNTLYDETHSGSPTKVIYAQHPVTTGGLGDMDSNKRLALYLTGLASRHVISDATIVVPANTFIEGGSNFEYITVFYAIIAGLLPDNIAELARNVLQRYPDYEMSRLQDRRTPDDLRNLAYKALNEIFLKELSQYPTNPVDRMVSLFAPDSSCGCIAEWNFVKKLGVSRYELQVTNPEHSKISPIKQALNTLAASGHSIIHENGALDATSPVTLLRRND
ncbi:MAG: hypothetical protein WCJ19_02875 [bacterium]